VLNQAPHHEEEMAKS